MKMGLIRNIIGPQNKGWFFTLRRFHGRLHEWFLCKRIFWCAEHSKKTNTVIATAFGGRQYVDNPKYIVEKIHELSPSTEIIWLCATNCKISLPSYIYTTSISNAKKVSQLLAKASIIIGNDRNFEYLFKRKDQLHIETWHGGLGFKRIGTDANRKHELRTSRSNSAYDFYVSNSDHLTEVYRSAFGYTGPVWKCGYPIDDALLNDNGEGQFYRERYNLPKDVNIVLYAPTFRSKYRWRSKMNVACVVETMQKHFGGKWVMMVHWHRLMRSEDRVMLDVIDATDCADMQSLVKAVDACITDYSSSIFQAVQCHIPCFVYADDYEQYNMDRGLYYPFDEQPFPYAFTNEQLIDNILHYDAALWEEKWQQYRKRMGHIVTGHSAEDVAKVCVDFLNGKPKADIMKEIPFETRF